MKAGNNIKSLILKRRREMIVFVGGNNRRMYNIILKKTGARDNEDLFPMLENVIGSVNMSARKFSRFKLFYAHEITLAEKGNSKILEKGDYVLKVKQFRWCLEITSDGDSWDYSEYFDSKKEALKWLKKFHHMFAIMHNDDDDDDAVYGRYRVTNWEVWEIDYEGKEKKVLL